MIMKLKKEKVNFLLRILFILNSFFHLSTLIISCINKFLNIQNGFYYGIFVLSLTLGVYNVLCIFFVKNEILIKEIIVIKIFSIIYSLFYLISLGVTLHLTNNFRVHYLLLIIIFAILILEQSFILFILFFHSSYFNGNTNTSTIKNKIEIKMTDIEVIGKNEIKDINQNINYEEHNETEKKEKN